MTCRRSRFALAASLSALLIGAWFFHCAASAGRADWFVPAGLIFAALTAALLGWRGTQKREEPNSRGRSRAQKQDRKMEERALKQPEEAKTSRRLPTAAVAIGLGLIILLGGWLRLSGNDWDNGQHLHPDERFLTMVSVALDWPCSFAEYLDEGRSPLNPRNCGFDFFAYGTLPTTIVKGMARLTGSDGYDQVHLLGRHLSGILETLSILLVFLIARRLYNDERVALLGALLMAVAVLPIQHAHFFVTDSWAVFFVTLSFWALTGAQRTGRWRDFLLAGLCWGLALTCKLSVYPFALMFPAVGLSRFLSRRQPIASLFMKLGAAGAVAFLAFRLGQPDAFRGPGLLGLMPSPRWLANLNEVRGLVTGTADLPPGHQWTDRTPLWFPWRNMLFWGLGPALGLTAWAAWAGAGWRWFTRRESAHLLPVTWVALLFVHQGTQWVKAMRYQLPIYPMLVVLAAWGLIALWDAWPRHRRLVASLIASVCLLTLGWALAFTSIYRQPHSRVAASRWILAHVPAGSTIANEHWDDPLPLRVDGVDPFAETYEGKLLPWYDEDTPGKLTRVLDLLDAADYIVLSSNRLSDSITRLPMRYPMTVKYYEALQQGRLDFDQAAEFTAYPNLFGLQIPDQSAEESFTVYDHPRVRIYRKSESYSRDRARAILGDVNWDAIQRLTPRQATAAPNGLQLPQERIEARSFAIRETLRPVCSGLRAKYPLLIWLALLIVLGAVGSCTLAVLLTGLPDRGWGLGRVAGWLAVGWASWMTACAGGVSWTTRTIVITSVFLLILALAIVWGRRSLLAAHLRAHWRLVVLQEGLFWSVFALFLAFRWQNPDLWHPVLGGEKPMNLAYLNAVLHTTVFPPANPWFAGSTMNYYYFGYVLVGAFTKLTGIATSVAYNLMIPTLVAMLASAAFSVSVALATPIRSVRLSRAGITAGLLGAALTVLAGNLGGLRLLWRVWASPSVSILRPEAWFWDPSRMIAHLPGEAAPITEFPFFTYLFADLHPHAMALPLTLLVVGLALAWLRGRGKLRWVALGMLSLALGALGPTNAWDWPVYAALAAVLLAIGHRLLSRPNRSMLVLWTLEVAALLILARLLYHPYYRWFGAPYTSLEFWGGSRTPIGDYLLIHGLFLWLIVPGLTVGLNGLGNRWRLALTITGLASIGLIFAGFPLPGLLLGLIVMVAALAVGRAASPVWRAALACVGLAFLLHLLVEVVVLKGDISRMNTVFKLYLQSWVLLAVAAPAVALRWLRLGPPSRTLRTAWWTGAVLLGAGALLYPLMATPARIDSRVNATAPKGLDGNAWMTDATLEHNGVAFSTKGDWQAIHWLRRHIEGQPVIAEANTWPILYSWGNRYSVQTGLPAVIGWDWHQRQQRAALPDSGVQRRIDDLRRMYETTDTGEALALLRRYRVCLVIVGPLERACYSAAGLAKFEMPGGPWQRTYRNQQVSIYRAEEADDGPTR